MIKKLLLSLSLSLSYTCSIIVPILTPLFHADPLHPRGGWASWVYQREF
jgi:hypothetical protein